VVTGSVLQGMAFTVPIGGLSFLVMTIAFGELGQLVMFPMAALTWLACQGIVHFVIGKSPGPISGHWNAERQAMEFGVLVRPALTASSRQRFALKAARELRAQRTGFDPSAVVNKPAIQIGQGPFTRRQSR
jgi:hypothetical protein